jgi:GT2 family glycosyltransferase
MTSGVSEALFVPAVRVAKPPQAAHQYSASFLRMMDPDEIGVRCHAMLFCSIAARMFDGARAGGERADSLSVWGERTMNDSADTSRVHQPAERPIEQLGIVIVTRNRVETLLGTLARLTALPERCPIVVVDNASTDGTPAAVRANFPDITTIALTRNLGGVARNYGVRYLSCPYVAFADDDSWWAPGSLTRAAAYFAATPRLGLIMARILVGPTERLDPACAEMARSPLPRPSGVPGVPLLGFIACGAIVRRAAFLEAGGFDPRFGTGGEEAIVAMSLAAHGWHLSYLADVVAHHHPSPHRPNMRERYIEGISDRLWEGWLRRPLGPALRITTRHLRLAFTDPINRAGVARAIRELPRILWQRRVVPPNVESMIVLLERDRQEG